MGIFKNKDAAEQAADSGRMRPEDLIGPTPERPDEAKPESDDAPPAKVDEPEAETQVAPDAEVSEARGNPDQPKNEGPAKVIAFANQKGGVAKTTTALNLAVAFKESGHRVMAVDMD